MWQHCWHAELEGKTIQSVHVARCWRQVLAFLDEQAAAADQVPNSIASTLKAMWAVLRILVAHNGSLRAAGRLPKGKPDEAVGTSQLSGTSMFLLTLNMCCVCSPSAYCSAMHKACSDESVDALLKLDIGQYAACMPTSTARCCFEPISGHDAIKWCDVQMLSSQQHWCLTA